MAQPVPTPERIRRQKLMEQLAQEGYMPLGQKGDMPSAAQEGKRRDGVNYARWIRDEQKIRDAGQRHYLPNWIGLEAEDPTNDEVTLAGDYTGRRAELLGREVGALLTRSRYPVINPDAVIVDAYLTRRYDRKLGDYHFNEGTPRTWLSDTLRVAPVENAAFRRYIFTGAQNDAPLNKPFWQNLKAYAAYIGAEIVVGPWTYETSWWSENNPASRAYAGEITDHLCFGQMAIGDKFVFCGEMNTLPTASQPISDLTTYPRNRWAAFPHAKRQLKSVPSTDPSVQSVQVMTTGAVTFPKIAPRKAGVKSLFHHVCGAIVAEFGPNGEPFCRQITAGENGAFYDLDRHVAGGLVTAGHRVAALVCGDVHLRKMDKRNALATFGSLPSIYGPLERELEVEEPVALTERAQVVLDGVTNLGCVRTSDRELNVLDRPDRVNANGNLKGVTVGAADLLVNDAMHRIVHDLVDPRLHDLDAVHEVDARRESDGAISPDSVGAALIDVLNPREVLLHDVFDCEARNHHAAGDHALGIALHENGRDSVLDEVVQVAGLLEDLSNGDRTVVVVESNHDLALERYIREGRYRGDPVNMKYGLQLDAAYIQHATSRIGKATRGEHAEPFSLLEYAVRQTCFDVGTVRWAYDNNSYLINGVECGHHGFRGSNGSKGTVQGFARTGRKMSIGDKHSPEINEGVYVAGVMQLQQGYNRGPSSWGVSHIVQYADGSRALITLHDGQWRPVKPRVRVKAGR